MTRSADCKMTSKGRNAVRLETEIEKSREESRWNRVIELADQLKQRSPHQGKDYILSWFG